MNEEREYEEFLQWMEFKRHRSQETAVVVDCEQPQLHLEETIKPRQPKYSQNKDVRNYKQNYSELEERAIVALTAHGVTDSEIADLLGRSKYGIKGRRLRVQRSN